MDTRLPVHRMAEAGALLASRLRVYLLRAVAAATTLFAPRLAPVTSTEGRCVVCHAETLGLGSQAASGATLCDDPACHADEIEGRW